ncbi:MAG: hypothetical protein ACR2JQ_09180 [Mycobacteriales bacterium]
MTDQTSRVAEAAPRATTTAQLLAWRWPLIGLAAMYSWLVGGLKAFSPTANLVIVGTGAVFLTIGAFRPPPKVPPPARLGRRGVVAWSVLLGVFAVQEVINDILGSTHAHPTLSVLMDPVLGGHLAKSVAVFVWIAFGGEMLRR